ncbi:MAG: hypothetical protein P8Y20_08110 [Gammaproteobacteria bacterium]|jgi:hypothetical protein
MAAENNNSSEIYADFTISRIDAVVRESLTPTQLQAVRDALVANQSFKKHAVDVRGTIPLFFARFYFVILAGRDKRRKTVDKEKRRAFEGNLSFGYLLSLLFLSFIAAMVWVAILLVVYWVKIELGIDLFSSIHLGDLFKSD